MYCLDRKAVSTLDSMHFSPSPIDKKVSVGKAGRPPLHDAAKQAERAPAHGDSGNTTAEASWQDATAVLQGRLAISAADGAIASRPSGDNQGCGASKEATRRLGWRGVYSGPLRREPGRRRSEQASIL